VQSLHLRKIGVAGRQSAATTNNLIKRYLSVFVNSSFRVIFSPKIAEISLGQEGSKEFRRGRF
jgi:hypothetical protein